MLNKKLTYSTFRDDNMYILKRMLIRLAVPLVLVLVVILVVANMGDVKNDSTSDESAQMRKKASTLSKLEIEKEREMEMNKSLGLFVDESDDMEEVLDETTTTSTTTTSTVTTTAATVPLNAEHPKKAKPSRKTLKWPSENEKDEIKWQKEKEYVKNLDLRLDNPDIWVPGDNITGWPSYIVPDIVHYILFGEHKISYVHLISFMSVLKIHRPAEIMIHCDCAKIDDGDENWERILNYVNNTNEVTIRIREIEQPTTIFGKKIRADNLNFHSSDITRYTLLQQFGGIYADNDMLVVQSLHEFRKFEFTLNWDVNELLGSQLLIAHPNARFLKMVMQSYEKAYNPDSWYFNAGELPTKGILEPYPQLVHRVINGFGIRSGSVCPYFYSEYHDDWQTGEYYAFHMSARGNTIHWKGWCLGRSNHPMWNAVFNDEYISKLNNTFGEMARFVLFDKKQMF